jgi:hypothetical protein
VTPPTPDQLAAYYRIGLIEAVIFLLLLLLAFVPITVLARDRWLRLGPSESLLARLAASAVLASIGVGGLSGVMLNLLEAAAFSDTNLTPVASRNQAVLGIALALAVTVVGIIRIEMHHRGLTAPAAPEEEADWKVEPPEVANRR